MPEREFFSLTEVSLAIGRGDGYVYERYQHAKPIIDSSGKQYHLHFVDPEKEAELQAKYNKCSEEPKGLKNKKLFDF